MLKYIVLAVYVLYFYYISPDFIFQVMIQRQIIIKRHYRYVSATVLNYYMTPF